MSQIQDFTAQNRRAWNEIASVRGAQFPNAQFFRNGGCTLSEHQLRALGDIRGLNVLHLQCATGEDTLSLASLGAHATGADISDAQIVIAQQKASAAQLNARFMAADVYALPADLQQGSFDCVYTGGGALCWLPDLEKWAHVVTNALKPGGRLVLSEEHPVASCLDVNGKHIVAADDYFRRNRPWTGTGWTHFSGGENAKETKFEFQWPLGDVVTAIVRAGLSVLSLEEFPAKSGWRFGSTPPEGLSSIPGSFLLVARKSETF